jgi:tape measure domain-containing protein
MLNLGTILFGLGVDTRGLDSAMNRVEQFGRTVQGAQTAANRGFDTSIGMLRRQENAILTGLNRLRSMQDAINKTTLSPQVKTEALDRLNAQFDLLSKRVTSAASGLDPTKIDRAVASFNQVGASITMTYGNMDKASRATAQAIERQTQAVFRADQAARNMGSRIDSSTSPGLGLAQSQARQQLTGQLEAAYQRFRDQMSKPVSAEAAKQFQREWTAALNDVQRKFRELGGAVPAASALENWRRGLRGMGDSMLLLSGHLGGVSTRFFALSQLISANGFKFGAAAAGVVTFVGATNTLIQSAIQSRLVLEKMEKGMTAVTGSQAAAAGAIDYVREVSDRAGIAVEQVAQSYTRLTASGKAAGESQSQINRMFEVFAQTSGTLSLSAEDAAGVFRALDQIMSKGTVQAEELRGQLGDRLPGAFALAAQAMGVTTAQLGDMMKKGDVLSKDFLPKFTEQVRIAFGVDTSKNIETMQASMQRLSNSWLFFGRSIDQAFGITNAYIKLLDSFSGILNTLSANMGTVVQVAGALAGAFAGLAVAMIAPAVLGAITTAWGAMSAALAAVRAGTVSLTAAQMALYAVMATTPWGAVISAVVRLGVVIGGAVLGWNMAKGAMDGLNGTMANLGPINAYIAQQQKLGQQVQLTTREYLRQAAVMARTQAIAVRAAGSELADSMRGPNWKDYGMSVLSSRAGKFMTPEMNRANRESQARGRYNQALKDAQEIQRALAGLQQVNQLPELGGGGITGAGGDDDGKKKKGVDEWAQALERAGEMVRKLNDDLKNANLTADLLFAGTGTPDFKAVDALMAAREQIQGLSDLELKALKTSMGDAGMSTETLTAQIANMIGQTNQAKDAVSQFTQVWDKIKEGQKAMKDAETSLQFLQRGGDPSKMWVVDATNKAYNAINELAQAGPKGAAAIEAIRVKLAAIGFHGDSAADALARFFMETERAQKAVDATKELAKAWGDVAKATQEASLLTAAYGRGEEVGKAMERLLEMRGKIAEFRSNMETVYGAGSFVDEQTQQFANSLMHLDEVQQKLEATKQKMEEFRDAWNDGFHSAYDNLKEWAQGSKSFLEAVTDTLFDVLDGFAQRAVDTLANVSFNALFGGGEDPMAQAQGLLGGILGKGGQGNPQALAAQSMNALTQAANNAAIALSNMSMMGNGWGMSLNNLTNSSIIPMGTQTDKATDGFSNLIPQLGGFGNMLTQLLNGMGGGGGGGGLLGSIISSVVNAGFSYISGGATAGMDIGGAMMDFSDLGSKTNGVTWAKAVDPALGPDTVETMATSGLSSSSKSKGPIGQTTITIDSSAHIDARGATKDFVDDIMVEIRKRDAKLRAELPYHIDSRMRENKTRLRQ